MKVDVFWSSDTFWSRLESDDAFIVFAQHNSEESQLSRHPKFDKQDGPHSAVSL